ncbi:MAG TPA: hypothetical protein ENK84_04040, partial [Desulfobulbus sp.]|nr:hypothetical protein [Desulfobulbus sp.]
MKIRRFNELTAAIIPANLALWASLLIWTERFVLVNSWPEQLRVVIWPNTLFTVSIIGLTLLLPAAGFFINRKKSRKEVTSRFNIIRWVCSPLTYLPLSLTPVFFWPYLPEFLPSTCVFFIPALVFATILYRCISILEKKNIRLTPIFFLGFFTSSVLLYWLGGMHFEKWATDYNGDSGHYIIQAESLYYDHDLDLKNNFDTVENNIIARSGPAKMHISRNAKNGHFYSWHPFGLSVLLAPLVPLGSPGLHLGLAIIAALGSTGLMVVCVLMGTTTVPAITLTLLFSLSPLWSFYAFQVLPETAGATAMIWILLAMLLIHARPWLSVGIMTICCFMLPWLQTRFIAPAAVAAAAYLLLLRRDNANHATRRQQALLFVGLSAAGGLFYLFVYSMMFEHARSYANLLLFSYLPGMYRVLFSWRSISTTLPLFPVMLAATIWCTVKDKQYRNIAIAVLAIFLSVLTTSCANPYWAGGSVMPGRFLLVTTPLLLPFAVRLYQSSSKPMQWFILFLGITGCLLMLLEIGYLNDIKKNFTQPFFVLPFYRPLLSGLTNFFYAPHDIFGVLLQLIILILLFLPSTMQNFQVPLLLPVFLGYFWSMVYWAVPVDGLYRMKGLRQIRPKILHQIKNRNTAALKKLLTARMSTILPAANGKTIPIEDITNNLLASYTPATIASITNQEPKADAPKNILVEKELPVNDWRQRGYRWGTLIAPFYDAAGGRTLCIQARREGTAKVELAVAELDPSSSHTDLETTLDFNEAGNFSGCFSLDLSG